MRKYSVLTATISALLLALISTPANGNGVETENCSVSGSFTITSGVISDGSFCRGTATIPGTVTSIGDAAFMGARFLTSISIPSSVTSMGNQPFRDTGLTSIPVAADNGYFSSPTSGPDAGVLFNKTSTKLIAYPTAKTGTSYSVPETVTSIGQYAFDMTTFTSITIPSSVTSIENGVFENSDITSITIPSSVTSISALTFQGATALTSITIPSSVTSIGQLAFWNATALTSITIPAGVTSIGDGAFENTTALTSVTFAAGSTLTSIGDSAFDSATSLTSITIPSSVTSIGDEAFKNATSLTSCYFLGNAPATIGTTPFVGTASGAKAYINYGATGFTTSGTPALWNGLKVVIGAAPAPVIANGYRADKLGTVYFAPLSSKLSKAAKKQIETLVAANPAAIYKVSGYVQKSIFAKNAKNDASLSLARARAVETYLASLGAGVNFTVVVDAGKVPAKNGKSNKARRATLYAMTPVVQ
jgi:hypothetical protein